MGDPRYQIDVFGPVFELAHARAQQEGWSSTSAWLRHLLRAWDGSPLEPRPRRTKQLSVRLDAAHQAQLEHIAAVSDTSLSEAFAILVERALVEVAQPIAEASPPASPPTEPTRQPTPTIPTPAIPVANDYQEWADLILDAARRTPDKFGDHKAFISGVLDELVRQFKPDDPAMFRAMVREILPQLNRLDLVPLVRADLVGVMPPELVKNSELPYLNATFHFVDLAQA